MKTFKEYFAKFLEEPTRDKLRKLLQENFGELDYFEFKAKIENFDKLSRHILAITNVGGGLIIIGVEEDQELTITPIGVEKIIDKAIIHKKTNKFLPQKLKFEVLDFSYTESEYNKLQGKKFQVIIIPNQNENLPFISLKDGNGIRKNAIYARNGTNSEEVDYMQLQEIINNRLQTENINSSELELSVHIKQLKELYSQISKYNYSGLIPNPLTFSLPELLKEEFANEYYPTESLDEFISRMIQKKKEVIEKLLS